LPDLVPGISIFSICTGIFARVAAGAAEEDLAQGRKNITPYWRTLKAGGVINERYPGGVARQKMLLQKEGHKVKPKGKTASWSITRRG
jgi:alkylated DNA nucleotide flippase Atl1